MDAQTAAAFTSLNEHCVKTHVAIFVFRRRECVSLCHSVYIYFTKEKSFSRVVSTAAKRVCVVFLLLLLSRLLLYLVSGEITFENYV